MEAIGKAGSRQPHERETGGGGAELDRATQAAHEGLRGINPHATDLGPTEDDRRTAETLAQRGKHKSALGRLGGQGLANRPTEALRRNL